MSVRKETIILDFQDDASAGMLGAAGAAKTLDSALGSIDGHATTVSRRFTSMTQRADKLAGSMGKANTALGKTDASLASMGSRGLVRFSSQTDRASASIDTFSGRVGLLGTAITAIGPGLIPITAAAVPAIMSVVAGMGAAAGAAGVLALAFSGVGDAFSAVSDYRLEPTAANLAKVQQAMEELGPAGAQFVMTLDRISPALEDLQQRAGAGIFPGFERGLNQLMTELPGVRDLVSDLSLTVGTLGEASANALTNDADWQEFFAHIANDGAPALESFGRATGNFTAGVANVIEALTSIGGGSASLVETSRAFREWADNLEHTEGFREFADYVRESGPQVADFLGATGNAMLSLAEAAAPWGQVVLPALTAFADVVGVIADSPLGPPLFAAAAAMLVFNKASALMGPNLERAKSSLGGFGTTLKQTGADLMTMSSGWSSASRATSRDAAAMTAATGRLKSNLASVGKQARAAGPGIAAFGFMASGAADKMGLSNTALLGMAGSMAGPWGAAAGAAVGLAMDFAAANDDVEEAVSGAAAAIAGADFSAIGAQMQTASAAMKDFKADVASVSDGDIDWDFGAYMKGSKNWVEGIFGKSDVEELQKRLNATRTSFSNLVDAGAKVGEAFDIDVGGTKAQKLAALEQLATKAAPAMSGLGITWDDLAAAAERGDGSLAELVGRMQQWQATADSAAGRTAAFGDALAQMSQDALSTAESASQVAAAFSAVLDPAQGLLAAQDGMTSTLHGLAGQLDATNKSLTGNSDAAIKNRAAISAGVDGIQNLNAAQAEANVSTNEMALTLNEQRQALIDSGVAAGLSRGQVERLVNQMGLTPDVVRTAFEAAGIDGVNAKTQGLINRYRTLPPKLQTHIQANGIPETMGQVNALVKKYNLTEKQRQALISLKDNATPGLNRIISTIGRVRGKTVQVKVDPGTSISTVNAVQAVINSLSGKTVTVTTLQRTIYAAGKMDSIAKAQGKADGGEILGQRYPYGDKVLIHAAPGEEIISNRHGQADAFRRDRAAGRIPAYADGGTITLPGYATGGTVRGSGVAGSRSMETWAKMWDRAAKTTQRALDDHKKQLQRATDRLDYWNQKRDALKSEVSGSLTRNWFEGGATDPWSDGATGGTVAYAQQQWKQQAGDSKKLMATVANLKKNGASDAFIAEILRSSDPLAAAQMFNKQSVAGMRHSQSLYLSATRATASAASYTSGVVYGDEIASSRKQVEHIRGDIHHLTALLKRQHKESEASKKKYSAAKAASKGKRSQKR